MLKLFGDIPQKILFYKITGLVMGMLGFFNSMDAVAEFVEQVICARRKLPRAMFLSA